MRDDKRLQSLIERLRRLGPDKLSLVEQVLDTLDCDDSSPLSLSSMVLGLEESGTSHSTTEQQRLAARIAAAVKKEGGDESPQSKDWPHAPLHRMSEHGTYMVTAGTFRKDHFFRGADRLDFLESKLLTLAKRFGWNAEAWAVFSNHYHFVANSQPGSGPLKEWLKTLHAETASEVNRLDDQPTRKVWFNFWDSQLTFEKSYLARLNYVHQNAVRHELVPVANQYCWCSAAWFERTASPAQVKTIYSFKIDRIKVVDDFEPL